MPLNISAIGNYGRIGQTAQPTSRPAPAAAETATQPFDNFVTKALDNLQAAQDDVDQKTIDFVSGGETELHNLMISSEKLSLGFNLTLQLRNKALDAYQEIMRTQV